MNVCAVSAYVSNQSFILATWMAGIWMPPYDGHYIAGLCALSLMYELLNGTSSSFLSQTMNMCVLIGWSMVLGKKSITAVPVDRQYLQESSTHTNQSFQSRLWILGSYESSILQRFSSIVMNDQESCHCASSLDGLEGEAILVPELMRFVSTYIFYAIHTFMGLLRCLSQGSVEWYLARDHTDRGGLPYQPAKTVRPDVSSFRLRATLFPRCIHLFILKLMKVISGIPHEQYCRFQICLEEMSIAGKHALHNNPLHLLGCLILLFCHW